MWLVVKLYFLTNMCWVSSLCVKHYNYSVVFMYMKLKQM